MNNKKMLINRAKQSGAALLVALIMLLAITLLGVTSLRSGAFHERMSLNSQADSLAFLGTESAINGVMSYAWQIGQNGVDDSFFATAILGGDQVNCVSKTEVTDAACTINSTFDRRANGILVAQASTSYEGVGPPFNTDGSIMAFHTFVTVGNAYFTAELNLPFAYENRQEWRKLGAPTEFYISKRDFQVSN